MSESETEELGSDAWEAEGKAAHPIELFFDLVYVFAFTRIVSLVIYGHGLTSVLQGALLAGLFWWSWGTWTWAMNAVDLRDRFRRVLILVAMGGIFLMGYAVPTAFEGDGIWLAMGYVLARVISSIVMWFGTLDDAVEHESIRQFLPLSLIAPTLVVIGGVLDGAAMQWVWLGALAIEVVSALVAGRNEWHVDAEHFAERHGLIMIIALGEAIIAVGVALTSAAGDDAGMSIELAWRLGVGLVGVCVMWWAYFDKLQAIWESRLHQASAEETGAIARDVYSLAHYPMILGIVFFAVALEEAFLHPVDPMSDFARWMLVSSITLYFGAQILANVRAWHAKMWERMVAILLITVFVFAVEMKAELVVVIVIAMLVVAMAFEYWRFRDQVRANADLRR